MGAGAPSCTSTADAPAARRSVSEASAGTMGGSGVTHGIEITPLPATTLTARPDPPAAPRPDASSPAPAVNTLPAPRTMNAIYGMPAPQFSWDKRRPGRSKKR